MKCQLCGFNFSEEESKETCSGCVFSSGCSLIRCPNCGFEEPATSTIVKTIKQWRNRT